MEMIDPFTFNQPTSVSAPIEHLALIASLLDSYRNPTDLFHSLDQESTTLEHLSEAQKVLNASGWKECDSWESVVHGLSVDLMRNVPSRATEKDKAVGQERMLAWRDICSVEAMYSAFEMARVQHGGSEEYQEYDLGNSFVFMSGRYRLTVNRYIMASYWLVELACRFHRVFDAGVSLVSIECRERVVSA